MNKKAELIIFDCDGVLVDSEIVGITLELSLLNQHGLTMSMREFTHTYSGMSWPDLLQRLQHDKGILFPEGLRDIFNQALFDAFDRQLVRIPGTTEVISQLDYRICVCSNSPSPQLDYMLTRVGLKSLFTDRIYSAVDLGPGRAKPAPDIFLHAAAVLEASAEKTIVIEDSVHGVNAAKAAGMQVIGFTGGSHTWPEHGERLFAAGASDVITQMTDLPAAIRKAEATM